MNKIIQGDSLEVLKTLESESVDCCVTSPPYWALRDYGVEGQLGLEPTFQEYINKLCDIFDEVKRVLKKEGTCWVNIGDTYGGSGKGAGGYSNKSTPQGYTGENTKGRKMAKESWNFKKAPKIENGVQKSLCQIPSRFAIEMTNRGWILRNRLIWHKPNAMPSSVKDRFSVDYEDIFFFVKSKKYWFEQQKVPRLTTEKRADSVVRDRVLGYDSKQNKMRKQDNVPSKNASTYKGFNQRWSKSPTDGKNMRSVWTITTKPYKEAHFATYPETLIEPMIRAGCPVGGIVLDPFFGAGTTGVVATKQNKKYIGIELNPEYIKIADNRIKGIPNTLFSGLKQDNTGNSTYTGFNKRWKQKQLNKLTNK